MNPIRILWSVLAVALTAFLIFESVTYGWAAGGVVIAFALLPDVPLLGAFSGGGRLHPRSVPFYNATHHPVVPAVVVAASFLPWPEFGWGLRSGLEIFLAGIAWLAHIAADRAFGYGLRAADGTVRPVGAGRATRRRA